MKKAPAKAEAPGKSYSFRILIFFGVMVAKKGRSNVWVFSKCTSASVISLYS